MGDSEEVIEVPQQGRNDAEGKGAFFPVNVDPKGHNEGYIVGGL